MKKWGDKQMSPLNPSESDIRGQVTDYLRLRKWFVWYILQAGMGVYKGLPDLMAAKNGEVIAVELKRHGGKQSEQQKRFQADYESAGCRYILTRGIDDLQKNGI